MTTYRSPSLTVDVVIEYDGGIVLIERRNPPHGYALPGGFVDYGETLETAAVREALEETSLTVTLRALLGVYSDPSRDARQHTVSAVFVAEGRGALIAADDAKHALVADVDALPAPLCFDHARILADYRSWRRSGQTPTPRTPLTELDRRTLSELAWQSLAAAVALPISAVRPALRGGPLSLPGACYVTLRSKSGALRGAAGSTENRRTLASAVEEMTCAAALGDAQHPPIKRQELSELRVEISVIATQFLISKPSEIVIGTHGLIVSRGSQQGVLLPEVAIERGLDAEHFAAETCVAAGLAADAWQAENTRLFAFTTEIVVATDD